MNDSQSMCALLRRHAAAFANVLDADLNAATVCRLDFSAANTVLQQTNLRHTPSFDKAVQQLLAAQQATIGIGGYLEERFIYQRSAHFDIAAESRSLHLGIDVWLPAGTAVFAPLAATVHSFRDNNNFGDYGPTIILQHELEGVTFYTLYGHLSRSSLDGLTTGKHFEKGAKIGTVGPYPENGDWPPHLHFQIITSMEGHEGDFPGVATMAEREKYAALCPDPNLILRSGKL